MIYLCFVPSRQRGAFRDRHERGTECGGRESVGGAVLVCGGAGSWAGLAWKRNKRRADDRRKTSSLRLRRIGRSKWRCRWLADGQVVWSWRSARGVELSRGGNPLAKATVATLARSPGRARSKPLKPLRREADVRSGPVAFLFPRTRNGVRGHGCRGHPAFPAPSFCFLSFEAHRFFASLGRKPAARGRARVL